MEICNAALMDTVKNIIMYKTNSSNVHSIGYDNKNHILKVIFQGGGTYIYLGVPEFLWTELINSESKGKYLQENIIRNKKYQYLKL